eukprot:NODE_12139_length_390_cov_6.853372_g10995_i0.p1 GENE.NODE_12139_length_390_cov_6.853372_g10995_i0~~NODE_12139_length_390_cov_6.853372_g10995_i0.p1  ORF type:complete len:73 (-),score=1.52 NODE_12139_length_390_cov_6.853372_g10995_i0:88-306(-)
MQLPACWKLASRSVCRRSWREGLAAHPFVQALKRGLHKRVRRKALASDSCRERFCPVMTGQNLSLTRDFALS